MLFHKGSFIKAKYRSKESIQTGLKNDNLVALEIIHMLRKCVSVLLGDRMLILSIRHKYTYLHHIDT